MKTVLVLGGDGFCGWPLALRLSQDGWHVVIVDNLARRKTDVEQGTQSLVPIATMEKRLETWKEVTGQTMEFVLLDIAADYAGFERLLHERRPSALVHLAEQRSAPYSMRSARTACYTVNNNLNATHNVLCAVARSGLDVHVVHIGTMGVYGYGAVPDTLIPEGYVDVEMLGKEVSILHPAYPGSIYHLTKAQDALMFQFYAKNYGMRITDLHQGILWGTQTEHTSLHTDLANRVDYDEHYGTVLNRFLIQASTSRPLTVYGSGGQTRAFLNVGDSGRCVSIALENPPAAGERVCIRNQMTETLCVRTLAERIVEAVPGTRVSYIPNPRKELDTNTLEVCHEQFLTLGLKPVLLTKAHLTGIVREFGPWVERCGFMDPTTTWNAVRPGRTS